MRDLTIILEQDQILRRMFWTLSNVLSIYALEKTNSFAQFDKCKTLDNLIPSGCLHNE